MKYLISIMPMLIGFLISACSNQSIYETFRSNRIQECQSLTGSERERCLENTQDNYSEYEQKRAESDSE